MARTRAKIAVSIWSDPEWLACSGKTQRVYLMLLSQSRLTLAGVLDYMPHRWAGFATDTTVEEIEAAVQELEEHGFVAVDLATEELAIRTLIKHDTEPTRLNRNIIKGIWSAWIGVMSPQLRRLIVANIDEELWSKLAEFAPSEALEMRRSPQLEPVVATASSDRSTEPVDGTNGSNLFPPSPSPSPPTTNTQPSSGRRSTTIAAVQGPSPHGDDEDPFTEFWLIYPKKRGRKDAMPAFKRAVAAGADPEEIIDGARRYAEHVRRSRTEDRFIKHAQGWINDERWTERYDLDDRAGELVVDNIGKDSKWG